MFTQTSESGETDVQAQAIELQANALLKFSMLAKQEILQGRGMLVKEARQKLRDARKKGFGIRVSGTAAWSLALKR